MLTTSWNEAEDSALRRLPWRARIVYLQGIRRYMDYKTGWAGKRRILSYQFFLELLECADHTTSPDPVVTKRGLQTIFLMLERVGLVSWPRGDSAQRGVVFHCLLADTDDSVQKQAVPKRYPSGTQEAVPGNASEYSEIDGIAVPIFAAPRQGEAVPPPVSGIRSNNTYETPVDRAPKSVRGTRLTLESLPDDWREWAKQQRPELDPYAVWDVFHDYWIAKSGSTAVKNDWKATWRNWVRTQKQQSSGVPHVRKYESKTDIYTELVNLPPSELFGYPARPEERRVIGEVL